MRALDGLAPSAHGGSHREQARERIKVTLAREDRSVSRSPPVARDEAAGDAVAARTVPEQDAARLQHTRELSDHRRVVERMLEETEAGEQVQHAVEPAVPARRKLAHVAAQVAEPRSRSARLRACEQCWREVEPGDIKTGFGKQVRVAAVAARNIEDLRAGAELEHIEHARDLSPIAFGRENGLVLEQVLLVKIRAPPLGARVRRHAAT